MNLEAQTGLCWGLAIAKRESNSITAVSKSCLRNAKAGYIRWQVVLRKDEALG